MDANALSENPQSLSEYHPLVIAADAPVAGTDPSLVKSRLVVRRANDSHGPRSSALPFNPIHSAAGMFAC
jgi:hypothetical protein